MIYIFDLDGTVIDSSHRHATLPCGALDLAHWIENSTEEKIFKDSLLPLAASMRKAYASGHHVVICTARVMGEADKAFLANNGLRYHALLCRREGETCRDGTLKTRLLSVYMNRLQSRMARVGFGDCIMFDDNREVLQAMRELGICTFNAVDMNNLLKMGA